MDNSDSLTWWTHGASVAHELAVAALTGDARNIQSFLDDLHAIALVDQETILNIVSLYSIAIQDFRLTFSLVSSDVVGLAVTAYGEAFGFSERQFADAYSSVVHGLPPVDVDGNVDILRWSVGVILIAATVGVAVNLSALTFTLSIMASAQLRPELDAPPFSPLTDRLEEL